MRCLSPRDGQPATNPGTKQQSPSRMAAPGDAAEERKREAPVPLKIGRRQPYRDASEAARNLSLHQIRCCFLLPGKPLFTDHPASVRDYSSLVWYSSASSCSSNSISVPPVQDARRQAGQMTAAAELANMLASPSRIWRGASPRGDVVRLGPGP